MLDPSNALAPEKLHDVMEMFLTALHLRKVGGEFWVQTCNQVMNVARCAVEVSTVHQIRASLKLDKKQDKVLAEVMNLTIQESAEMRRALVPVINMLQQMPCPRDTIH